MKIKFASTMGQIAVLFCAALCVSVTANALSPVGIPWTSDWGQRTESKAAHEGIKVVDAEETRRITEAVEYLIFDARSAGSFKKGHLPGAISLPINQIDASFPGVQLLLSPDQPILVYCSGSACDESLELAMFLKQQGYEEVAIFVGGFAAWREAGYEIEYGL